LPFSPLKLLDKHQFLIKVGCFSSHLSNLFCEMTETLVEHSVLSFVNIRYKRILEKND